MFLILLLCSYTFKNVISSWWIDLLFIMNWPSFPHLIVVGLNFTLPDIKIANLAFFWLMLGWCILFHLFFFFLPHLCLNLHQQNIWVFLFHVIWQFLLYNWDFRPFSSSMIMISFRLNLPSFYFFSMYSSFPFPSCFPFLVFFYHSILFCFMAN